MHSGNLTLMSWSQSDASDISDIPPHDPQSRDPKDSLALQAAEYGLGRLSSMFVTTHAVNLLIEGTYILYLVFFCPENYVRLSRLPCVVR